MVRRGRFHTAASHDGRPIRLEMPSETRNGAPANVLRGV